MLVLEGLKHFGGIVLLIECLLVAKEGNRLFVFSFHSVYVLSDSFDGREGCFLCGCKYKAFF